MRDVLAELIGTFILVFAITTAIVGSLAVTGTFTAMNLIIIAFTAGLVLITLVYTFGSISGGHFNPAVTLGLLVAGKFPAKKVVPYLSAQFIGGILASIALWFIVGSSVLGATTAGSFGLNAALFVEIIATALFLIVILSVTSKNENHAGLAIGLRAGQGSQGNTAVAIGQDAGQSNQGTNSVAIGPGAGNTNQGAQSVAIGISAGRRCQILGGRENEAPS